ncbi:MAG: hypothetical protein IJZ72_01105 [Oscillospiraceae bacterium]|nr:hypothetical protein [Oscillospiraceae bacterium]
MRFINENAAINGLADYIVKSGVCLYNTVKYLYSLAENDFYNVNIKDVLKIMLNNMPETDGIKALGLRIDDYTCREMQGSEYNKVLPLMVFSLAVRIPVLKNVKNGEDVLTDDQLYKIYCAVLDKGAENVDEIITETFLETKYLVRKAKKLPPFTADWYKTYIYAKVPALAEITNKNMFLIGFVDMVFAMFYSCMTDGLAQKLLEYADENAFSEDDE